MRAFMTRFASALALLGFAVAGGSAAWAAGGDTEGPLATGAKYPNQYEWSFEGPFGTFDDASVQRGYQVYKEVCAACHSLNYVSFRNLGQRDGPFFDPEWPDPVENPRVKALAANYIREVSDIHLETGDVIQRAPLPSDRFPAPYPNKIAAAAANGGAAPPDLSLMVKARKDGANYLKSLLLGYQDAPEGFEVPPGGYYNPYFEGRVIAMPPQLNDGMVTYSDGTEATKEQMAADLTNFLHWTAEPTMEARKRLGGIVLVYLFLLAGLLYAAYKTLWRKVEH